jgi:hypothetical protein
VTVPDCQASAAFPSMSACVVRLGSLQDAREIRLLFVGTGTEGTTTTVQMRVRLPQGLACSVQGSTRGSQHRGSLVQRPLTTARGGSKTFILTWIGSSTFSDKAPRFEAVHPHRGSLVQRPLTTRVVAFLQQKSAPRFQTVHPHKGSLVQRPLTTAPWV